MSVKLDSNVFIKCIGSEKAYLEALEHTANFNMRMSIERKQRLPFIDSHTGVAQSHTDLFQHYRYRNPGKNYGQIYTYPSRRWKKKKRSLFLYDIGLTKDKDAEIAETDMPAMDTVETGTMQHRSDDTYDEKIDSQDKWYDEMEAIGEIADVSKHVDDHSDISDYEDQLRARKRKKKESVKGHRGRRRIEKDPNAEDKEKPYVCEVKLTSQTVSSVSASTSPSNDGFTGTSDIRITANNYCDFCLGDSEENKKTRQAEQLVSCSDCGRSGHPSCLQFTDNMIISVKKYPWQCIECKSCGLCGTSDNDDQLLFCDDCDRGYHMYCLNPPLTEPPEGNWSCHLCIKEFHGGNKPDGMQ